MTKIPMAGDWIYVFKNSSNFSIFPKEDKRFGKDFLKTKRTIVLKF